MSKLRLLAVIVLSSSIASLARAQPQAEKFERSLEQIREQTLGIALALGVVGLLNVQFAVTASAAGSARSQN